MIYVVTSFLFLFFIFSIRHPQWAGIFILSTLPSYLVRFTVGGIPFTLLEGMIWMFLVASFITNAPKLQFRRNQRKINKKNLPFIFLIILFVISGLISVFVAPEFYMALGIFRAYIVEAMLFVLVFVLVLKNNMMGIKYFLYILGATTLLISLYAIFQKITGFGIPNVFWQTEETRRVVSIFEYPNALGLYLGPLVVLYFGVMVKLVKYYVGTRLIVCLHNMILSFVVFISSLLAIIFAVSEGALFGVAAGMAIIIFFTIQKRSSKIHILTSGILITMVLLLVPITRNYFLQKISFNDFSGEIRTTMWSETMEFLKTSPIFGAGLSGYKDKITPFHKDALVEVYLYPHNFFLNFWVEMGLLGLISIIGLLIVFFIRTRNIIIIAIMIEILVHGMVDAPFFKNDLSIIFLMVLAAGIFDIPDFLTFDKKMAILDT